MAVTDQTAQSPQQAPPPNTAHPVADTALGVAALSLLPTPPSPTALAVDAAATLSSQLLGALRAFQNRREATFQEELKDEAARFGPDLGDVASSLIDRELGYEQTFRGKQFNRVQASLQEALALPDKTSRDAKIRQIFEDERRYTQMREVAMRQRVIKGMEHFELQQRSPEGAFWQLGEARTHTPDCFPGSVLLGGPVPIGAARRPYAGQLVEVVVASGDVLPVTPNHPILTSRGFVAAKDLQVGDDLFRDSGAGNNQVRQPHDVNHMPSSFAETFDAMQNSLAATRMRNSVGALDFHGDVAGKTDVDVVGAYGDLRYGFRLAALSQPVENQRFLFGDPTGRSSATCGECGEVISGEGRSTATKPRLTVRFGDRGALLAAHRVERKLDRFAAPTPYRDPRIEKALLENAAANSLLVGQTLERFSGVVATDEIVDVRYVNWSGHVYNAETDGGWYTANGFIVGNCLAMAGRHWPWEVLADFQPPVHPKCACRLLSTEEAVHQGLMDPADVQDPMSAQAEAVAALRLAQEAREALGIDIEIREAAWLERYPKGTEFAGRFKPRVGGDPGATILRRMGLRRRGQKPEVPVASHTPWTRLGGKLVKVPRREWRQTIGGVVYHSPEGSTNVYRDGQLMSAPPEHQDEIPAIHHLADEVRVARRAEAARRSGNAPLRKGDGPQHVLGMEDRGYDMTDVAPAGPGVWRATWTHRLGLGHVHAHVGRDGIVKSARYDPAPAERQRAALSLGPSRTIDEHTADAKAWSHELADRYGTGNRIRDVSVDPDKEDHAGWTTWGGDIQLGKDVKTDIERAARARAEGRPLTDDELRGVWASMWSTGHEVGHSVNPITRHETADPENTNLEEALTEESAHRLAKERLISQGQSDVLDWVRRNPTDLTVRGVYRSNRGALADIFDKAGLTGADRDRMVEQLKFKIAPRDRFRVLGALLRQGDRALTQHDAEQQARQMMRNGSDRPRAAGLETPGIPEQFKQAYQQIANHVANTSLPVTKPERFKAPSPPPPPPSIGGDVPEPAVQGPIPNYRHVKLTLGGKDFGSDAQKAKDESGAAWLVQHHNSDRNHIAEELLAGAVYKALGVKVSQPGIVQTEPSPDFSEIPDALTDEPPLPTSGRISTGVILRDKNGKVTLIEPRNHYGGYTHTFPKGGLEKGLTPQQNALKELWEETGLHGRITGVVGDFKGDTGSTRYYVGVRTGGTETPSDETQAIKTVSPKDAVEMLNKDRDKKVLSAVLGIKVPTKAKFPDVFPTMKPGMAAAYPVPAGKTLDVKAGNDLVARDYVADALLGNWDFVGTRGANMRWQSDTEPPTRMNLGSSFEYDPHGRSKPYEQVPTDLWTMLRRGQAAGRVQLTDEQLRDQARKVANELTLGKINTLVDAAPFADDETRERIRAALTARVAWLRDYGDGLVDLPQPASGQDARDMLTKANADFEMYPEEQAALQDFLGPMRDRIDEVNRGKQTPDKTDASVINRLDALIDATDTPDDFHTWVRLPAGAGAGLAGQTVKQRSFTPSSTQEPDGPKMRVMVPGGSRALFLPDEKNDVMLPRGSRLRVDHVSEDGNEVHATLLPYTPPVKPYLQPPKSQWSKPATWPPEQPTAQFVHGDHVRTASGVDGTVVGSQKGDMVNVSAGSMNKIYTLPAKSLKKMP